LTADLELTATTTLQMVIEMNLSPLTAAASTAALVAAASVLAFSAIPALFVRAAFIGWASYGVGRTNPQYRSRHVLRLCVNVRLS
jgi:hypothetical protein